MKAHERRIGPHRQRRTIPGISTPVTYKMGALWSVRVRTYGKGLSGVAVYFAAASHGAIKEAIIHDAKGLSNQFIATGTRVNAAPLKP